MAIDVAATIAFGMGLSLFTAPRGPLGSAFGLLLAWSWTLGLVLPALLVIASIRLLRIHRGGAFAFAAVAAAIVVVTVRAFVIEPTALEVEHQVVHSDRVDAPIRIAVVADLQTDAPGAYETAALRAVMAEKPDLIVMPGDFVQRESRAEYERAWAQLRDVVDEAGLTAPLGVFLTQGDVEHARWETQLVGTEMQELHGRVRVRDDVWLTGLDLATSRHGSTVTRLDDAFSIVAGHAPDFALGDVDADLLVAGHTHGGQVQLPWLGPIVTLTQVPRSWASGRTAIDDDTTLIVSRGVGMERGAAPRLRLLCPPQIVIVDVLPAAL